MLHSCVNIYLSFLRAVFIRWTSKYTMLHVYTCLLSKTRTSSSHRRRTTSWRRRTTTYITGFSVTFLCKYVSVFLTRCCWWTSLYTMFHVSTCLLSKTRTSLSRRRRTTSWRRRTTMSWRRRDVDVVTTSSWRRCTTTSWWRRRKWWAIRIYSRGLNRLMYLQQTDKYWLCLS